MEKPKRQLIPVDKLISSLEFKLDAVTFTGLMSDRDIARVASTLYYLKEYKKLKAKLGKGKKNER